MNNKCKFMQASTELCNIGCKAIGVIKANVCPFADSDPEAMGCPRYRGQEASYTPKYTRARGSKKS